jgi:hypothetical protein
MFPIVEVFAWQILGVVGFQIETERIFSLAEILTNLEMLFVDWKFREVDICQQKLA